MYPNLNFQENISPVNLFLSLGALFGVIVNLVIPSVVILILLVICLCITTRSAILKGLKLHEKEKMERNEIDQNRSSSIQTELTNQEINPNQNGLDQEFFPNVQNQHAFVTDSFRHWNVWIDRIRLWFKQRLPRSIVADELEPHQNSQCESQRLLVLREQESFCEEGSKRVQNCSWDSTARCFQGQYREISVSVDRSQMNTIKSASITELNRMDNKPEGIPLDFTGNIGIDNEHFTMCDWTLEYTSIALVPFNCFINWAGLAMSGGPAAMICGK